jgi:hypothetical protein
MYRNNRGFVIFTLVGNEISTMRRLLQNTGLKFSYSNANTRYLCKKQTCLLGAAHIETVSYSIVLAQ